MRDPVEEPSPSPGAQPLPGGKSEIPTRYPSFPGPRTKERKVYVRSRLPGRWDRIVIGTPTEAMDLVDCLHKALPKQYRAKGLKKPGRSGEHMDDYARPSMRRKMAAVYRNFDKIDAAAALACFLQEQVEDYAYGYAGRRAGRAARELGLGRGFELGPEVYFQ